MTKLSIFKFLNILQLIVFLFLLFTNRQQLDITGVFIFTIAPIVISFVINLIEMKLISNVSLKNQLLLYSGSNVIYLIVSMVLLSNEETKAKIFALSEKYSSEFVTVSQNDSPLLAVIICTIIIVTIHYMIISHNNKVKDYA